MNQKIKKTKQEFFTFLKDQKVISLSIAVIIGGAAKDLVNSIVANLIMPLIGLLTPDGSWRQIKFNIGNAEFGLGGFLGSMIDFVVIALLVFFVTKKILKIDKAGK